MYIIPDYESYDFVPVESMTALADLNGLEYPSEFEVEHEHNELDSFFNRSDEDPVELFMPYIGCC